MIWEFPWLERFSNLLYQIQEETIIGTLLALHTDDSLQNHTTAALGCKLLLMLSMQILKNFKRQKAAKNSAQ